MSRIGKLPITLPQGVTVSVNNGIVKVTGPKGELSFKISPRIEVKQDKDQIIVSRLTEDKATRSNHGAMRAQINHMVLGVVTPFKKDLEIRGTGYKAVVSGNKLTINAGFIHPVVVTAPIGIQFTVADDTKIQVTGCDKIQVGQVASDIRKIRTPEPYKGKGIRYADEVIKLKAGKTAKA